MRIVQQLSISLPNKAGSLARMSDTLRASNVNIEALFCSEGASESTVHLVTDDSDTAALILRELAPVTVTDVLAVEVKNKPGTIATLTRQLAMHQINIRYMYATAAGNTAMTYIHVSDAHTALKVLT